VLRSAELQRAADEAGLTIDPAGAGEARANAQVSKQHMAVFAPFVRAVIDQANQ
jgi:hypothetical protein